MYTAGNAVYRGATIGAGVYSYFKEGVIAARMLIAHLQGDIDIATAGINLQNDMSVGVNLDVAADQGLEISSYVLDAADFVVKDGGEQRRRDTGAARSESLPGRFDAGRTPRR